MLYNVNSAKSQVITNILIVILFPKQSGELFNALMERFYQLLRLLVNQYSMYNHAPFHEPL